MPVTSDVTTVASAVPAFTVDDIASALLNLNTIVDTGSSVANPSTTVIPSVTTVTSLGRKRGAAITANHSTNHSAIKRSKIDHEDHVKATPSVSRNNQPCSKKTKISESRPQRGMLTCIDGTTIDVIHGQSVQIGHATVQASILRDGSLRLTKILQINEAISVDFEMEQLHCNIQTLMNDIESTKRKIHQLSSKNRDKETVEKIGMYSIAILDKEK